MVRSRMRRFRNSSLSNFLSSIVSVRAAVLDQARAAVVRAAVLLGGVRPPWCMMPTSPMPPVSPTSPVPRAAPDSPRPSSRGDVPDLIDEDMVGPLASRPRTPKPGDPSGLRGLLFDLDGDQKLTYGEWYAMQPDAIRQRFSMARGGTKGTLTPLRGQTPRKSPRGVGIVRSDMGEYRFQLECVERIQRLRKQRQRQQELDDLFPDSDDDAD